MKFIIEDKKAGCYYARNCETGESVNIEKNQVTNDLLANSVVECDAEDKKLIGTYKKTFTIIKIINEIYALTNKDKILVEQNSVKLGDLIDNAPIMSFGKNFVKDGKKVCYAYFKV